MDENWDYVMNGDKFQYGTLDGPAGTYTDAIDGWEAENFYFNGEFGFCTPADNRKQNTEKEKYSYISSFGDNTGQTVEWTPVFVTKKTMGGYATGDTPNVISFNDENIDELYIDYDGDNIFEENELVETDTPGEYQMELSPAQQYNILAKRRRNQQVGIGWSYLESAESDLVVQHGKVFVEKIERKGEIIVDGLKLSEDGKTYTYDTMPEGDPYLKISCNSVGGDVWVKLGDVVTLRLVPQYGYQLASADINGQKLDASETVSTYTVTVGGNLHFSSAFVPAEDKIETLAEEVTSATIINGENATDTGNLELVVEDNKSYTTDVAGVVDGTVSDTVATLELSLNNIVSKGEEGKYWSTPVTEFEKDITLDLGLEDVTLADGESLSVVRDHKGTLTELETEYDADTKTLSFPTNQFSTYTIVKKSEKQEQPEHKHSLKKTAAKAATCTKAGNKEYWTCSGCKKIYGDAEGKTETTVTAMTIAATGHRWDNGTITKKATATKKGEKTYKCKVCGAAKKESIPATGIPAKGTKIKDEKGKAIYKVTGNNTKNPTVTYMETKNSKATAITIPPTVTVEGITYKVTAISDDAFKGNKKITKVTISKNVASIGKNTFNECIKLKTVTIGSNVTTIGTNAFRGCKSLIKMTLPSKTTKIGANAFNGCSRLNTITIKSKKMTDKTIAKNAFKGVSPKITIQVPKGKAKAYKSLFRKKGLSKKAEVK